MVARVVTLVELAERFCRETGTYGVLVELKDKLTGDQMMYLQSGLEAVWGSNEADYYMENLCRHELFYSFATEGEAESMEAVLLDVPGQPFDVWLVGYDLSSSHNEAPAQ